MRVSSIIFVLTLALALMSGCNKQPAAQKDSSLGAAKHHQHVPPHGGTVVVLGDEAYHLELVLDSSAGKIDAYVLDGEMENFVRVAAPQFEVVAQAAGVRRELNFKAVANSATGETLGDTAAFEATADWLKKTKSFDGELTSLTIRDTEFAKVKFNFPNGNER